MQQNNNTSDWNKLIKYYTHKSNNYISNCGVLGSHGSNNNKKIINKFFGSNKKKCELFGTSMLGKVTILKPLFEIQKPLNTDNAGSNMYSQIARSLILDNTALSKYFDNLIESETFSSFVKDNTTLLNGIIDDSTSQNTEAKDTLKKILKARFNIFDDWKELSEDRKIQLHDAAKIIFIIILMMNYSNQHSTRNNSYTKHNNNKLVRKNNNTKKNNSNNTVKFKDDPKLLIRILVENANKFISATNNSIQLGGAEPFSTTILCLLVIQSIYSRWLYNSYINDCVNTINRYRENKENEDKLKTKLIYNLSLADYGGYFWPDKLLAGLKYVGSKAGLAKAGLYNNDKSYMHTYERNKYFKIINDINKKLKVYTVSKKNITLFGAFKGSIDVFIYENKFLKINTDSDGWKKLND